MVSGAQANNQSRFEDNALQISLQYYCFLDKETTLKRNYIPLTLAYSIL